jgi:hypothetical protein
LQDQINLGAQSIWLKPGVFPYTGYKIEKCLRKKIRTPGNFPDPLPRPQNGILKNRHLQNRFFFRFLVIQSSLSTILLPIGNKKAGFSSCKMDYSIF